MDVEVPGFGFYHVGRSMLWQQSVSHVAVIFKIYEDLISPIVSGQDPDSNKKCNCQDFLVTDSYYILSRNLKDPNGGVGAERSEVGHRSRFLLNGAWKDS